MGPSSLTLRATMRFFRSPCAFCRVDVDTLPIRLEFLAKSGFKSRIVRWSEPITLSVGRPGRNQSGAAAPGKNRRGLTANELITVVRRTSCHERTRSFEAALAISDPTEQAEFLRSCLRR